MPNMKPVPFMCSKKIKSISNEKRLPYQRRRCRYCIQYTHKDIISNTKFQFHCIRNASNANAATVERSSIKFLLLDNNLRIKLDEKLFTNQITQRKHYSFHQRITCIHKMTGVGVWIVDVVACHNKKIL